MARGTSSERAPSAKASATEVAASANSWVALRVASQKTTASARAGRGAPESSVEVPRTRLICGDTARDREQGVCPKPGNLRLPHGGRSPDLAKYEARNERPKAGNARYADACRGAEVIPGRADEGDHARADDRHGEINEHLDEAGTITASIWLARFVRPHASYDRFVDEAGLMPTPQVLLYASHNRLSASVAVQPPKRAAAHDVAAAPRWQGEPAPRSRTLP